MENETSTNHETANGIKSDVISRLYDKVATDTKADRSRIVAAEFKGRLSFYELDLHEEKVLRYLTTLPINGLERIRLLKQFYLRLKLTNFNMKKIISNLKRQVANAKKYKNGMDEANWGYEQGVLITPNEALAIIEALKQVNKIAINNPVSRRFFCNAAANDVGGCKKQCVECLDMQESV